MKKMSGPSSYSNFRRYLSVMVMCCCLLLLTGSNFFIFSSDYQSDNITQETSKPQGPVEEKSQESKSLTNIQEEYLHDNDLIQQHYYDALALHKIHEAEKLPFAPSREIYSPPRYS